MKNTDAGTDPSLRDSDVIILECGLEIGIKIMPDDSNVLSRLRTTVLG